VTLNANQAFVTEVNMATKHAPYYSNAHQAPRVELEGVQEFIVKTIFNASIRTAFKANASTTF
jgi:hypothetical protein